MTIVDLPEHYSVPEVVRILKGKGISVCERTIHNYIDSGELKSRKRFGKRMVGEDQLTEYIMGRDDECEKSNELSTENDTGSASGKTLTSGSSPGQMMQNAGQIASQRRKNRLQRRSKN